MAETTSLWTAWSPYWSYQEDFFLDLDTIDKLTDDIMSPVLIVGAGQGLLVEHLQKKGFKVDGVDSEPQMVMYAKQRRGLDLVQADARDMPFATSSCTTSIIATGVIDFMDDEQEIRSILDETRRVTDDSGSVFVAFYKYHPRVERLLKLTNLITDDGVHRFRQMYEMMRLSVDKPAECIRVIKNKANVGLFGALLILIRSQMFLPKKEKLSSRRWSEAWKKASKELDDPQSLIDSVPEFLPYRNEERVRELFKQLDLAIQNVIVHDSCTIVEV